MSSDSMLLDLANFSIADVEARNLNALYGPQASIRRFGSLQYLVSTYILKILHDT